MKIGNFEVSIEEIEIPEKRRVDVLRSPVAIDSLGPPIAIPAIEADLLGKALQLLAQSLKVYGAA